MSRTPATTHCGAPPQFKTPVINVGRVCHKSNIGSSVLVVGGAEAGGAGTTLRRSRGCSDNTGRRDTNKR